MSNARDRILSDLRHQSRPKDAPLVDAYRPGHDWNLEYRVERLTEFMRAVRTEVVRLENRDWIDWLNRELPTRGLSRVLVGANETGGKFRDAADQALQVSVYDEAVEACKQWLFGDIDVGVTTTLGGIAETGSLILWPDTAEPRLLSLAPPVHVALLDADTICNTFADAVQELHWAERTPTNALLISGPSKTADIEQTLAYGIHGPRQLIVLVLG